MELASVGDINLWEGQDTLSRVYRSFTYPEIMALADPERALPKTMRAMDDALRVSAARGFAKSTNVTQNTLLIFPWKNHAKQHGLGLSPGKSLNRGSGMSMG